jgi:hypothetical protein
MNGDPHFLSRDWVRELPVAPLADPLLDEAGGPKATD